MFENSRLIRYKAGKPIECLCINIDATQTFLLLKPNRKTVSRYFPDLRRLIYLSIRYPERSKYSASLRLMKVSLAPPGFVAGPALEKEGGARSSSRSSTSMSVTERFAQNWSPTALSKRFKPSSGARFRLRALSIPAAGKAMTDWWVLGTANISVSTNPDTLRKNQSASTASKHSGALQNAT